MSWSDFIILGLGSIAAIALTIMIVLMAIHQIMITWGRATFAAATLAEAMHRARYYRWAYERLNRAQPLIDQIENIVDDFDRSADERLEEIELLLREDAP